MAGGRGQEEVGGLAVAAGRGDLWQAQSWELSRGFMRAETCF